MRFLTKAMYGVLITFVFSFICVGYSALTDSLSIGGSANVVPNFDEIVIIDVTEVSKTSGLSESSRPVITTSVQSDFSGSVGQSVVYKITAHNFSETDTYVYTGMYCDNNAFPIANKLNISASTDEGNTKVLPNNINSTCSKGTPIAPGEDFVFYVTYTLTGDVSTGNILVKYDFKPIIYTVTYLDNNEVFAIDCVTNNGVAYDVIEERPENGTYYFAGWVNANAVIVQTIAKDNENDYTLTAKWDNVYLIIFVDESGTVLYQESFTDTSKKNGLSAAGQAIIDQKLSELAEIAAKEDMSVAWSDYDIKNATSDITVRPIYTYTGNLKFTPIDTDNDGIIEYYRVDAVAKLNDPTKIPGEFKGLQVEVVNKLYLNDNNFDYGAGVKTIEIGEGVKRLERNALAYTADLSTVKLPSTMEYIGKNAFSRNFGDDKKVLTIEFNGTMAEWKVLVNSSDGDWHNGLKTGSVVKCSDGYFELDRGFLGLGGYDWEEHKY